MATPAKLIIACGALAQELIALKQRNAWGFLDVTCVPANLHNHPQKITGAVQKLIDKHLDEYDEIFVAYADCGTGGHLDTMLQAYGVDRLPGNHCYEFFAGTQVFSELADAELGTFYLTDFLAKHFDRIILKDLGVNKHPELLEMYFAHYKKLVFLDQSGDPKLDELAMKASSYLGLEYQKIYTGLDKFEVPIRTFFTKSRVKPPCR